jgi:hypothetical protein
MQDARISWPRTIRDTAGAVNIAETRMEPSGRISFSETEAILHPRPNG